MESDLERSAADESYLRSVRARWGWIRSVRPMALAALLARLLPPADRRRVMRTRDGLEFLVDPLARLGNILLADGEFEPDNVALIRAEVEPGQVALDLGANEGFFSAVLGRIVGPSGKVVAVEPQARLRPIIEANLALNGVDSHVVLSRAVGRDDGETGEMSLYPAIDSGASGLVRNLRFFRATQPVSFISPERILEVAQVDRFDFVKLDVEGFETRVVEVLLPLIRAGRVRKLYIDYHAPVLAAQGIDPAPTHAALCDAGLVPAREPGRLEGYVLYRLPDARMRS